MWVGAGEVCPPPHPPPPPLPCPGRRSTAACRRPATACGSAWPSPAWPSSMMWPAPWACQVALGLHVGVHDVAPGWCGGGVALGRGGVHVALGWRGRVVVLGGGCPALPLRLGWCGGMRGEAIGSPDGTGLAFVRVCIGGRGEEGRGFDHCTAPCRGHTRVTCARRPAATADGPSRAALC